MDLLPLPQLLLPPQLLLLLLPLNKLFVKPFKLLPDNKNPKS